jgi:tight adherence protein B
MITWALAMVGTLALWQRWVPRTCFRRADDRPSPRRQAPTEWADVADTIGVALRTGHSLRVSIEHALQQHEPAGLVLRLGATLDDVLTAQPTEPDEAVVVRAVQTAWRLGGPAAAGMHAAAALLRERRTLRAEARAQSAQARASARVLTGVPLAFAALGAATSASFRAVIVTPSGATAALTGALLNGLGWQWMRLVVRRATA